MTSLVAQELKDDALAILENLYPEIEIAYFQAGNYDETRLDAARAEIDRFQERILSKEVSINPNYVKTSELAAELVHFSYRYPEEFLAIFNESEITRDIDVRTVDGVFALGNFFSAIGDDHSYCLDPASDTPLLKGYWQFKSHVKLVNPKELLESLQAYRSDLEARKALTP